MSKENGRGLHQRAAEAREKKQYLESLGLNDQALMAYDEEKDLRGFAEAIANRSITFRVYAGLHQSESFLILAKFEMMGAVEIARKSGDPSAMALPLYNLAEVQEALDEFKPAVTSYREAVASMTAHPPKENNRPGVLADMKAHMATCEYKAGDKAALDRVVEALNELDASDEFTFNKDVWVSGGYMRLAAVLQDEDLTKAKQYLMKAKKIIDANPDLTIRKEQWEKLAKSFEL